MSHPLPSVTHPTTRWILALMLVCLVPLAACGGDSADEPAATDAPAPAAPASDTPAAAPAADPGGLRPMTSRDSAGAGTPVAAAGLVFELPADWRAEQPSSSMRAAQAVIPGPDGEGQLTVFHFGPGGGGGVESNLQRWAGQVEQDADIPSIRDQFDNAAGLRVTWIDIQGTLLPSTMGAGPTEPQPGSRLLGAVVEGEGGPWFFKATGPAETLAKGRDALIAMLQAASLQG